MKLKFHSTHKFVEAFHNVFLRYPRRGRYAGETLLEELSLSFS